MLYAWPGFLAVKFDIFKIKKSTTKAMNLSLKNGFLTGFRINY